jgi:hypothetical protein
VKTYKTVIADRQLTTLDWQSARTVEGENHGDAAARALRTAPLDNPGRVALSRGDPCWVWVWDESHPKHLNGAPMCVHCFQMGRAANSFYVEPHRLEESDLGPAIRFPTREQAEQALAALDGRRGKYGPPPQVVGSLAAPTTTFDEWNNGNAKEAE